MTETSNRSATGSSPTRDAGAEARSRSARPPALGSTHRPRSRPGKAGYWIGPVVALLAIAGAATWGVLAFLGWRAHVEDFARIAPPGRVTVSVTEPGTRILFLEHDRSTAVPPVAGIVVTGPSGAPVRQAVYRGEMRYDVPAVANRVGDAVRTFEAQQAGAYRITVGAAGPGTTVAVGDDLVRGWGPHVVGIVVLLGGVSAGLALVLITGVRRSNRA